jgi:hypothetical protein
MEQRIKFAQPQEKVKLDFRALPTPMVGWEGTAQELHDILFKAWAAEPGEAGQQ